MIPVRTVANAVAAGEVEAADYDRNGRVDLYVATYVESSDVLLLAR